MAEIHRNPLNESHFHKHETETDKQEISRAEQSNRQFDVAERRQRWNEYCGEDQYQRNDDDNSERRYRLKITADYPLVRSHGTQQSTRIADPKLLKKERPIVMGRGQIELVSGR